MARKPWTNPARIIVALMALAAGMIHLKIAPGDWNENHLQGIGFAVMGVGLVASAIAILVTRRFDTPAAVFAIGIAGLYLFMRVLPANPLTHEKEHFESLGNLSAALEFGTAAVLATFIRGLRPATL